MSTASPHRPPGGIRLGHALLILALGTLTFAARMPSLRREGFERRLAETRVAVADLQSAAERFRGRVGRWPEGATPGATPAELAFELPRRFDPRAHGYALQWTRWERTIRDPGPAIDSTSADDHPPGASLATPSRPDLAVAELGAITVVSADPTLLAALLLEHGPVRSFVTDSTWTLLLYDPRER